MRQQVHTHATHSLFLLLQKVWQSHNAFLVQVHPPDSFIFCLLHLRKKRSRQMKEKEGRGGSCGRCGWREGVQGLRGRGGVGHGEVGQRQRQGAHGVRQAIWKQKGTSESCFPCLECAFCISETKFCFWVLSCWVVDCTSSGHLIFLLLKSVVFFTEKYVSFSETTFPSGFQILMFAFWSR